MARLVLRSALLISVLSLMSACVVPLAPEFQDPPTSSNYAPYFQTVMPDLGYEGVIPSFDVTVTDPNIGDDLFAKWIVDYPPYSDNTRAFAQPPVAHNGNGAPLLHDFSFAPNCIDNNLAKIARHQIMIVVADRAFSQQVAMQAVDLTRLTDETNGRKVIGTWTLDMECK